MSAGGVGVAAPRAYTAPASSERPQARARGWASIGLTVVDVGSAVVEVALVFAPVQVLLTPARGLWAVLAVLLALAAGVWGLATRRMWAPLRAAMDSLPRPGDRRASSRLPVPLVQAGCVAGTRLGFASLWLRTALLTAVAAVWGGIGMVAFRLPPQGLLLALWAAALLTPHLGAWRALVWQGVGDRWLQQLVRSPAAGSLQPGSEGELRLLRDTFQGRLVLTALAGSGLFGLGTLGVVASVSALPGRAQLELWWWLPPALIGATLAWMAWLRRGVRPIERFIDAELESEPHRAPGPASRPSGLGPALRATQRLPYELAAALWLSWTAAALLALLGAGQRFALGPVGVLQQVAPIALVMFAAALYQVPFQQTVLFPLWPRLTARLTSEKMASGQMGKGTLSLPWLLGVPVALLMLLWELLLGLSSGGQPGQAWLAGGVLVAVALGGALWLLRDTMRPLRALRRRVEWLSGGEFARRGDSPGELSGQAERVLGRRDLEGDEVGHLAAALTAMQRALGERLLSSAHAQIFLEQQVSARTGELQRRNEELRGALAELEHAQAALLHSEHLASIGRLVAGIAHEINNPINAVVNTAAPLHEALAELLDARSLPEQEATPLTTETLRELPDMLRVIQRGARRTQEIVRALHSYTDSDPEVGEPADVHRILAEALELVQHPAKAGVTITQTLGPLPAIVGHAGQLQQVFINLLSNALYAVAAQAASTGGEFRPHIDIQTAADPDRVRIAIRDNGTGIPPAVRLHIFDPFFTTKDASSGSGLGLSIAHSIVSRHGGTIAVESAEGSGACFAVTLPIAGPPGPG